MQNLLSMHLLAPALQHASVWSAAVLALTAHALAIAEASNLPHA